METGGATLLGAQAPQTPYSPHARALAGKEVKRESRKEQLEKTCLWQPSDGVGVLLLLHSVEPGEKREAAMKPKHKHVRAGETR
jgi:hypothetical protein